ncbi:hypothetical protein Glove_349g55 [Diversispora epigaea]|uniref:Uncharacterized protein n=1 Tax=Diversispora epigaea TaxID=1348612 RepID=A0A397HEB8_9GLOM|nr:hypothetical protein Glove_349g55 [Diversispora epigaea]
MNSRLFSIYRRKFIPTKVFYKTKSGPKFGKGKLKDPNRLPNSAKLFLPIHRKALNMHYQNVYSAEEIFDPPENIKINNDLLVGDFTKDDLLIAKPGSSILNKLNNKFERTLARYLNEAITNDSLTTGVRKTFTNNFVCFLLTNLEFNIDPLLMRLQSDYSFNISDKEVTAKIEFSIEKNNKVLFIDEDKHLYSLKPYSEYGESQISAEILACAFTNFYSVDNPTAGESQMIYATRVIGTRFTFYKAFLSSDYCESLKKGFPPDNLTVTISRFPSNDQNITRFGYDYANKNHRCLIIDLLYRLKECLLEI